MTSKTKQKKLSAVIATDSFYHIFFGEDLLDDDNLPEVQQFIAKYGEVDLINFELIPEDYRTIVFFEPCETLDLSRWTHKAQAGAYFMYLLRYISETEIEFNFIRQYASKIDLLSMGKAQVKVNKFGLAYFEYSGNIVYMADFNKI